MSATASPVLGTAFRVLTFRATREELDSLGGRHLAFGLIVTWLVGMGRYWTHPKAHLLQYLGLGSVIYVLALSLLLYVLAAGLRARELSYRRLLTFVTLTAPPAALYAIPVSRLWDLATAQQVRLWFLGIVALWRVSLYAFYLRRAGGLSVAGAVIGTLLPIMIIVAALAGLNLEKAVFDFMRAQERPGTPNDEAYAFLVMITFLSVYGVLPVLGGYLFLLAKAFNRKPPAPPSP